MSWGNSINVGASREKPRPAKALLTTREKPLRVITKEGIPIFSAAAAARPAAVEQLPQAAIPAMTPWHPFSLSTLMT
jgi:hypothetical protein